MKVLLESSHKLTAVILSGFLFSQHVFSNCRYIDYMHPYIEKVNFIVDFFYDDSTSSRTLLSIQAKTCFLAGFQN